MQTGRRAFLVFGLAALAAGPALAAGLEDDLVAQLRAQGFTEISVSRTWLGRVRILAEGPDGWREIVFNPRTGEILRDYWEASGGSSVKILSSGGSGKSGNGGDGKDDDDDDDDDEDHDDDNSGHGGGN
ncbi:MAG: hypothetical protein N2422_13185 [Rhodobacteraceae bacterium]|nr:hypothetical protein [Paracoccaceae bacterium]